MNVRNIKIVIAILLVIFNIIFAIMLSFNFRNRNYYDKETVEKAYNVIENGGISIERGILERKQKNFYVYIGGMHISSSEDIMALYGDFEDSVSGDVGVVSDEGRFVFRADGTFFYSKYGDTVGKVDMDLSLPDVIDNGKIRKDIEKTIDNFLKLEALSKCPSNAKSVVKASLVTEKILFDSSSLTYTVFAYQTFDGERVSSSGTAFVIKDGEVLRADGAFSFIYPNEKVLADCIDMLNIIFSEKKYLTENEIYGMTLSDISYFYRLYDSAEGRRYFIPMCRIIYEDSDFYGIYNLVSGKRM